MNDAPAGPEVVVQVRGLATRFGQHWIHRDLSLTVHRGEVVALVGQSGSGKTTLLREIIGLERPHRGRIEVLGQPVGAHPETHRLRVQTGVLFQQGALFSSLNVFDNVAFPIRELRTAGMHMDEDLVGELVMLKLQMVGLRPEDAWKLPAELSGGMVKRAALARALALEGSVLFLDEPTSGLDPHSARELDALLVELHRELGLSALMITHDLGSMEHVADRIAVLAEGRVMLSGTFRELAAHPAPVVKGFFGDAGGRALTAAPT